MDKPYLWLVNGCLEYHWPKLVQLTIPDITKLVPILPRVFKEGNLNILFQGLVQEVKHEQRLQYSSNSAETTEKTSWLPVSSPSPTLGSLSSDIFEWRTSTGTVPFSLLICLEATIFAKLSVFTLMETICPRIWSKPRPKSSKSPLPVYVHHSKTLLLNP